jgi:SAM-dependent methyltransferase
MPSVATVTVCPLCGGSDGQVVRDVEFGDIWDRLAADWSAEFDPVVVESHTPRATTSLVECASCELQYFSPSVPGSADFYEQLTRSAYYEDERWEFGVVAGLVAPGQDVVDVGCGRGAFLELAAGHARRAVGVDHNPSAVDHLRSLGIEAHALDFADFAASEREAFDVVCGFQILEHLPSVDALIEPALECLRPGGRIFVSVPHRERYVRSELEPFDCPPHHISRWHPDQFARLAERHGLVLETVRYEQPDLDTVRLAHRRRFEERWAPRIGARAAGTGARALGRLRVGERRHRRAVARSRYSTDGLYAHTVLAELRLA